MSIDLEAQLRAVGHALDTSIPPVSAAEVTEQSRHRTELAFPRRDDTGHPEAGTAGNRRWLLSAAAATILVTGMVAAIGLVDRGPSSPADGEPSSTPQAGSSPIRPSTSSAPGDAAGATKLNVTITPTRAEQPRPDRFPIVRDPNAVSAFGQYEAGGSRGSMVTALVGEIEGDRLSDGIRIELRTTPPEVTSTRQRQVVEIDGTDVDVYDNGDDTSTAIVPGEPTIAITGLDPTQFLQRTGLDVVTFDAARPLESLTIDQAALPDGYDVIVEPVMKTEAVSASTVTALEGGDGPAVGVSRSNPLTFFATRGVLERTEVNGIPAWGAATPGGHTIVWPVSESTWAQARVRGGPTETITLAASTDYAAAVEFVDETEWRAQYRVAEPSFAGDGAVVGIDAGRDEGIGVGMLVEVDGIPVGRIGAVTDSDSVVVLAFDTDFSVPATIAPAATTGIADCRVRGGNDHVGYVCDRPFDQREQVGAEVVAAGASSMVIEGTSFGTITRIIDIDGEQVALLDLAETPVAGDSATVVIPG
jgi:hypothetical protein